MTTHCINNRRLFGLAPFELLLAPLVLVGVAACSSGDILSSGLDRGGGPTDTRAPGTAANPPAGVNAPASSSRTGGPTTPGGAMSPRVFKEGTAIGCDPSLDGMVADTPLRRLTQEEYDNSLRDIFGFELTPKASSDLPKDGSAGPFSANFQSSVVVDTLDRFQLATDRVATEVANRITTMLPCAAAGDDACARMFIKKYGTRAYRRPLSDAQVDALMTVYTAGAAGSNFAEGINYTVQAMLLSPSFIYHLETKPKGGGLTPVSEYELAERLSYFIWRSIPDDELLEEAGAGTLATPEGIKEQAKRMFADSKAAATLDSFTEEWLNLGYLKSGELTLPLDRYPDFTPEYSQAALAEVRNFVRWVLRDPSGDGKLETLLTSNMSLPHGKSFDAYDTGAGPLKPPSGYDGKQPVMVPGRRAGVLAMPATMMGHAAEATSPIKRGVFVMHELVCIDIQLPVGIDIPPVGAPPPGVSIRQQLANVTKDKACMGCHRMINPIGFAFEAYDRMGRERTKDEFGADVDDKGVVELGDPTLDGPIEGAPALAQRIFQSDSGRNCMMQQVFRFALGRLESSKDSCGFAALAQQFEESDFNVRDLLLNVVVQDSFRFHPGT